MSNGSCQLIVDVVLTRICCRAEVGAQPYDRVQPLATHHMYLQMKLSIGEISLAFLGWLRSVERCLKTQQVYTFPHTNLPILHSIRSLYMAAERVSSSQTNAMIPSYFI